MRVAFSSSIFFRGPARTDWELLRNLMQMPTKDGLLNKTYDSDLQELRRVHTYRGV